MKNVLLLALVMFFASAASAQDEPKIQAAVNYSFLYTPQASYVPSSSLSGAGASLTYFFSKRFGLKAEFADYGSHSQNISVPASTQGCNSLSNCTFPASGNVFTYTVGPVLRFHIKRFDPFAEVMFGGAHNNIYADIYNHCIDQGECINLSKLPNNNAFDLVVGGGLDLPFSEHIAFRLAQVDYVRTGFGNSLVIGNSDQNNLRFQAGVVIRF
jgi:Outer membrane protein beta-barrel domain